MGLLSLFFPLIFLSQLGAAQDSNPPYNSMMENEEITVDVAADGLSTERTTQRVTPINEAGRLELVQSKITYWPDRTKIKFISGAVYPVSKVPARYLTTRTRERMSREMNLQFPVEPPRQAIPVLKSSVVTKEIGIGKNGIQSMRALVIPLPNLEVGASGEYTYEKIDKPIVPGIYSESFVYGTTFPELQSFVKIRSVKPLYYKLTQNVRVLEVKSFREGAKYVLTIEVINGAFPLDFKGEALAYIRPDQYPKVFVSTSSNWRELAAPLAKVYDAEINKPLPKDFIEIAKSAETQTSDDEKFNSVVQALAKKITYAGNWNAAKDGYFPKGHQFVAAARTGDCKDFATSMTAILRKLGYRANVALTYRGEENDDFSRDYESMKNVVSASYFNHAIVHVTLNDKSERWIDPTNVVADAKSVFVDIQRSPGLVIDGSTTQLSRLPSSGSMTTTADVDVQPQRDGTVDVSANFKMAGSASSQMKSEILFKGVNAGNKMLTQFLLPGIKTKKEPTFEVNAAVAGELSVKYSYSSNDEDYLSREKGIVAAPYPVRAMILALASRSRVSDFYVGEPGESVARTLIRTFKAKDDVTSDCFVRSQWFDIDRVVTSPNDGVLVEDKVTQKVSIITSGEMKSDDFDSFMGDVGSCLRKPVIQAQMNAEQTDDSEKLVPLSKTTVQVAATYVGKFKSGSSVKFLTAIRAMTSLLEKEPKNVEARRIRAISTYRLGYRSGTDYAKAYLTSALSDLDEAVRIEPKSIPVLRARTYVHFYLRDLVSATRDFNEIRKRDPRDATSAHIGSLIARARGQNADAEKWLIFDLNNTRTQEDKLAAYDSLGNFYLETQKYAQSIEAFNNALKIEPKNAWVWNNISIAYIRANQFDRAIASAKSALEISNFGAARANLADAYCQKADSLMATVKAPADLDKIRTGFEESVFEGMKTAPNPSACLKSAAGYYEDRAFDLGDAAAAAQALTYYKRYEESNPADFMASDAVGQMSRLVDGFKSGKKVSEISANRPKENARKFAEVRNGTRTHWILNERSPNSAAPKVSVPPGGASAAEVTLKPSAEPERSRSPQALRDRRVVRRPARNRDSARPLGGLLSFR